MKIFVTGTRGIPDIPGGVEKHCQELYPRIVSRGHQVWVSTRTPYLAERLKEWEGVNLIPTYAPRIKSLEAIIHTFISIIKAWRYRPDVVHIHAIGPSLLTPLARLMGFKAVITNHGPDYERAKWGWTARKILLLGEKLGCKWANEVIVISQVIAGIVNKHSGRASNLIFNGVEIQEKTLETSYLEARKIRPGGYILAVSRFVPEKGLHDLMMAFSRVEGETQLVIAGDADHETEYSRRLRKIAEQDHRIILTGYIGGDNLRQVFSHAGLFVLPSYHEGLPIALLEAMSYGINVLASDIPANKQISLPDRCFFRLGDTQDLTDKMKSLLESPLSGAEMEAIQSIIHERYDWDKIVEQTIEVYKKVLYPNC
jgi:glycosyltransferase involved in cell wall biosynthesis